MHSSSNYQRNKENGTSKQLLYGFTEIKTDMGSEPAGLSVFPSLSLCNSDFQMNKGLKKTGGRGDRDLYISQLSVNTLSFFSKCLLIGLFIQKMQIWNYSLLQILILL